MRKLFLFFTLLFLLYPLFIFAQWESAPINLPPGPINKLASDGTNIVAASYGVWLSTDSGLNWNITSFNNHTVSGIAIKGNDIYAGTYESNELGIFKSTDLGLTWEQTSLNNRIVETIVISGNTIFAGFYNGGASRSTDNGVTWNACNFLSTVYSVKCFGIKDNFVYAGGYADNNSGYGGLYVSSDYGISFRQSTLNYKSIYSIAIKGNVIYASTLGYNPTSGILISTNNGSNWTQTSFTTGTSSLFITENIMLAGTYGAGIKYSTNDGQSWLQSNVTGNYVTHFSSLGNKIFASSSTGLYVSINNGINWITVNSNFTLISSLIGIDDNSIFAGVGGRGLYKSSNSGTNWNGIGGFYSSSCFSLVGWGNYLFAGTNDGIERSFDMGQTWSQTGAYIYAHSVAINSVYVFAGYNGIYRNNIYFNTSWTSTNFTGGTVLSIAGEGTNVYAGTENNGVYKSSNNGDSWFQTTLNNKTVKSLAVSGNTLYAGTLNSGVYLSTNGGTSWNQTSINNQTIFSLAVKDDYVFAGSESQNNFYISTNRGNSWSIINQGIENIPISSICLNNSYVFVGTMGSNVFRIPLSTVSIQTISTEIPGNYSLSQNYPNPFNPTTKINFSLPKQSFVTLRIFDITGREVAKLLNEMKPTGVYSVDFNGADFASGVYFYRIEAADFVDTKRMVLVK